MGLKTELDNFMDYYNYIWIFVLIYRKGSWELKKLDSGKSKQYAISCGDPKRRCRFSVGMAA